MDINVKFILDVVFKHRVKFIHLYFVLSFRTHVCEARFVLSSRAAFSPLSNAAFLNKLTLNSPEEQHLFKQG